MESIISEHDMTTRRQADTVIIEMATAIGELRGELREFNKNQKDHNDTLHALLEKNDTRMDGIEGKANSANDTIKSIKNRAIGAGAAAGILGTGAMAKLMAIFHG